MQTKFKVTHGARCDHWLDIVAAYLDVDKCMIIDSARKGFNQPKHVEARQLFVVILFKDNIDFHAASEYYGKERTTYYKLFSYTEISDFIFKTAQQLYEKNIIMLSD